MCSFLIICVHAYNQTEQCGIFQTLIMQLFITTKNIVFSIEKYFHLKRNFAGQLISSKRLSTLRKLEEIKYFR